MKKGASEETPLNAQASSRSSNYSFSFLASSWLMIFGLPWPRICFMHCPTKNPISFWLPSL